MEKKMVSGRVPLYVVKYVKDHNISYSDLLMAGFDAYRENDEKHALQRLQYHEERVIHWRQNVIQIQDECNTKQRICNTVKETFLENKRDKGYTERQNKQWLQPKVADMVKQNIPITVDELYEFCMKNNRR